MEGLLHEIGLIYITNQLTTLPNLNRLRGPPSIAGSKESWVATT